jgi:hypothetical protein
VNGLELSSLAVNLHIIPLMMLAEIVFKTVSFFPQLTKLAASEDFIMNGLIILTL